jgi:uncharacterized membrane protein
MEEHSLAELLHLIGLILGLGGALLSCGVMLRLKEAIARKRGRIARFIAPFTWVGLLLLIVSGVMLTAGSRHPYPLWLGIKHVLVLVILVDAILIHFLFFPRFFARLGTPDWEPVYRTMRRIGTLSFCCWLATLALSFGHGWLRQWLH